AGNARPLGRRLSRRNLRRAQGREGQLLVRRFAAALAQRALAFEGWAARWKAPPIRHSDGRDRLVDELAIGVFTVLSSDQGACRFGSRSGRLNPQFLDRAPLSRSDLVFGHALAPGDQSLGIGLRLFDD